MIKVKNYTEKEIKYIEKNFNSKTIAQIAESLNKKESSIYHVARKLGLSKQKHSKWTDDEIKFLKDNYINMTSSEIARHIDHSVDAINTMRDRLNLVRFSKWSEEDIQYLKDNYETTLFSELSKVLKRSESAIRAKCFELNLFKNTPWTDEESAFVKENYREMKTSEISQLLNRTMSAIELKASRMGLKKYPYTCDYHYFDVIDTEEKAYWLGFLTADGWINKNEESNAGVTGIELQYGDIKHLKKFNKSIGGNYQITDRWKPCPISSRDKTKKNHMCVIRIFSLTMYDSLTKKGFTNNKTYDCHIPVLRQDLLRHYLRGYFDGDGCLSFTGKSLHVNFATASKILNNDLIQILKSQEISYTERTYITEFNTTMYRVDIYKNRDRIKFLNWIYKDCNIYLDRKYQKYQKIINHYNNKSCAGLAE